MKIFISKQSRTWNGTDMKTLDSAQWTEDRKKSCFVLFTVQSYLIYYSFSLYLWKFFLLDFNKVSEEREKNWQISDNMQSYTDTVFMVHPVYIASSPIIGTQGLYILRIWGILHVSDLWWEQR